MTLRREPFVVHKSRLSVGYPQRFAAQDVSRGRSPHPPAMGTPPRFRRKVKIGNDDPRSEQLSMLAAGQHGVVSRRQLYRLRVTRWEIQAHLRAERWQRIGDQSIVLHTGRLCSRAAHTPSWMVRRP
jgi:hypothetical protein